MKQVVGKKLNEAAGGLNLNGYSEEKSETDVDEDLDVIAERKAQKHRKKSDEDENTAASTIVSTVIEEPKSIIEIGFRIYTLHQVPVFLIKRDYETEPRNCKIAVEVQLGDKIMLTNYVTMEQGHVNFDEGINLPVEWPSDSEKILLRLLIGQDEPTMLATSAITVREICNNYEKEPTFGPALINFYGVDSSELKWTSKDKEAIISGQMEGTRFIGKLLFEISTNQGTGSSEPMLFQLNSSVVNRAETFYDVERSVLFCNFIAANHIPPVFKKKEIKFIVSIGRHGNDDFEKKIVLNSNQTIKILPTDDKVGHYTISWGNKKPVCEVPCHLENMDLRFKQINALLKIVNYLEEIQSNAISPPREDEYHENLISSVVFEAMEFVLKKLDDFNKMLREAKKTQLDNNLNEMNFLSLKKIIQDIEELMYSPMDMDGVDEFLIQKLCFYADRIRHLAHDPQAFSHPDILIRMIVDNELVGYARIPVIEAFYCPENKEYCGKRCGRIYPIYMKWPTVTKLDKFKEHVPCVLQTRLWIGRIDDAAKFEKILAPGRLAYYQEMFYNEKWKEVDGKFGWQEDEIYRSDESRAFSMDKLCCHMNWEKRNDWNYERINKIWIGLDSNNEGVQKFKAYQVQHYDKKKFKWVEKEYTTSNGKSFGEKLPDTPPEGLEFISGSEWRIDFHCRCDVEGWNYSICQRFSPRETLSEFEGSNHSYRRRGYIRLCESIEKKKEQQPVHWSYAETKDAPLRSYHQLGDEVTPRIFAKHNFGVPKFMLCVYLVWARELPVPYQVGSSFVRAYFLDHTKKSKDTQSGNTTNPVWNETLLFEDIDICAGYSAIKYDPPMVMLEVVESSASADDDVILGRCHLIPKVRYEYDTPANLKWHQLEQVNAPFQQRGSIFASADLFHADIQFESIPKELKENKSKTHEVMDDVKLQLSSTSYTVQFLSWGLRELRKGRFATLRKPFIQILIGDKQARMESLVKCRKNSNFERPYLRLDTKMPGNLASALPMHINLFEQTRFHGPKLIGICIIRDLDRFRKKLPKITFSEEVNAIKEKFTARITDEKEQLTKLIQIDSAKQEMDPFDTEQVPLDWWSKYRLGERDNHFDEKTYGKLLKLNFPLEVISEYQYFDDFLETFYFFKPDLAASYNRQTFQTLAKAFFKQIFSRKKQSFLDAEAAWAPRDEDFRGALKGQIHVMPTSEKDIPIPRPSGIEFSGIVPCLLRVYVVRAWNLESNRTSRSCDSYVKIKCGKKKLKKQNCYVPDSSSPIYGQLFEMPIKIPQDSLLTVTVMDNHRIRADRKIGSTNINLENRLLTNYRATVGLPSVFRVTSPFPWRDQVFPLELLQNYCDRMHLPPPRILTSDDDVGISMVGIDVWAKNIDPNYWRAVTEWNDVEKNGEINTFPLQMVALFILRKVMGLVPEHVETRPLYHSKKRPYKETGRVELFVDLFPIQLGPIPPPIDISPRKPRSFQLRLVVWKARNAGDIYLRIYTNGASKREKTDIHYRCLNGYASFNWRFLLDFDYDPWERKFVVYSKDRLFRQRLVDPILIVELWDNNKFGREGLIGECQLNLLKFEVGQFDEYEMPNNIKYEKEPGYCQRTANFCKETRCCIKRRSKKQQMKMPRAPLYVPGEVEHFNLFQHREVKGWWPCIIKGSPNKKKSNADIGRRKKDEYYDPEAYYATGFVELEMSLLSKEESEKHPVGKKRNKPNHSPHLPNPDRLTWDSYWCTSRVGPFMRYCWRNCGWQFLLIFIIVVIIVLLTTSFIYQAPQIVTEEFLSLDV
uniref:C2 domain-containing protein n=1 Tax=Acrobeloides nanus TaxID=290746 RepID=A0A914DU53_9BILA